MDQTGHFARDDDAGVEMPPSVGTDERRMHVRAYNYWVSLLDNRAYPSIEDLDPANMDDFGPHSVLLDFTGGAGNPKIAFLGHALRKECDLGNAVDAVEDIPSRSLLSRLTDHYLQIIANRAPIGFEAEFVNTRGNNTLYRGILMPFSSDDDNIDFIYGVINWKEVADDAVTNGIIDEVERALQTTPVRHDAPVNVWADGPSGETQTAETPASDAPAAEAKAAPAEAAPGFGSPATADEEEIPVSEFAPDGTETLWDWLAAARETADAATHSESRSRQFLYRALSLAYDFAAVADKRPEEYSELLTDNRIVAQARAPMTPIVKLVFGIGYDKTRLAEYGMALAHGRRLGVGIGEFQTALESHPGGLKGMVYAERAERRPVSGLKAEAQKAARELARAMTPRMIVEQPGEEEFVLLVARRIDPDHVGVLGAVADGNPLIEKALRSLAQ